MIINILDLDMTENYDVVVVDRDGLADVASACNHQVISNLVRARLLAEIDWRLFSENPQIEDSILAQQMRKVIDAVPGVVSSEFLNFRKIITGRNVEFTPICFTVDCNNSQECFTI